MNVLVTGHLGYIGTLLVPMLIERGFSVRGCDVGLYQACRFAGEIFDVTNLARDIRDLSVADFEGFEAVIHLAGLSNDPLGDFRPELTFEVNRDAAVRAAKLARQAGVKKFLFASTCSIYGASDDQLLVEDSSFRPVTPYAESKRDAEAAILGMADDGFSPCFLRAGTVYGVSPMIRFDLVLNNLVAWAMATGRIHLKSDGRAWRPLVHVADIARAYVDILEAPAATTHARAFNVGDTRDNFQIRELAERINARLPKTELEFAPGADADRRNYRVGCERIAAEITCYRVRHSIDDGIDELHEALAANPVAVADFEGMRYSRIGHIKHLIAEGRLDDQFYWT